VLQVAAREGDVMLAITGQWSGWDDPNQKSESTTSNQYSQCEIACGKSRHRGQSSQCFSRVDLQHTWIGFEGLTAQQKPRHRSAAVTGLLDSAKEYV
jgi:hypothetical protein